MNRPMDEEWFSPCRPGRYGHQVRPDMSNPSPHRLAAIPSPRSAAGARALAASQRRSRLALGLVLLALIAHAAVLAWWTTAATAPPRWPLFASLGLLTATVVGLLMPALARLRHPLERLLQQAAEQERLALVAEHTGHAVLITDARRRIVWANEAFTRHSGYELHEAQGRDPAELLQPGDGDPAAAAAWLQATEEPCRPVRAELPQRSRDGRGYCVDADIRPLHDLDGRLQGLIAVLAMLRPVAEAAAPAEADDGRGALAERLQRCIEHRRRHPGYGFALLSIAVDGLGAIEQRLGAEAAASARRELARRLEQTLRPGDAVGALDPVLPPAVDLGGDAFAVVLGGLHWLDDACTVADRLLQRLSQPYETDDGEAQPLNLTVSIGIVGPESAGDDAPALLQAAEAAMLDARRAGGGRWAVFEPAMQGRFSATQALAAELQAALDEGQFELAYQPLVALNSGQPAGVEALLRWRHPAQGELALADFLAAAQQAGLGRYLIAISDWASREACRQFAAWQSHWGRHAPPRLVLDLAAEPLRDPALLPSLQAALQAHGLRPGQLQLDLTEAAIGSDEPALAALRTLKAAGFSLALDDFGSGGASSLTCLHRLPVDTVKIGRALSTGAAALEHQRVRVSATIRVARSLGMATLADGVETEEQADLLARLGCELAQGPRFGRPMTAAALDRWIEAEAADTTA
jgi:PAS domain S-box-containing protein/diguanylate cyclase (GGDEF)-like protein